MTEEERNEVSLVDLIKSLYSSKFQILFISLLLAFVFLVSSFLVTTKFTNKSIVIINEEISKPKIDSTFSVLANLGGLELNGSKKDDEYIEIVKSKKFAFSFLSKNSLLTEKKNSKLSIEDYLEEIKSFQRNFKITKSPRSPSYIFSFVSDDLDLANEIPNKVVLYANEYIKNQKKEELLNEINFLEDVFTTERNEQIKLMIASLIQGNLQSQTLALTNKDYPFKFIDEAILQKEIFSPNKIVRFFIGFLLGFFISILLTFSKTFKIS